MLSLQRKIMRNPSIKSLPRIFKRYPDIAAVYLFGSVLHLGLKAAGDVDVAVLYGRDRTINEFRRIQEQQNLSSGIGKDVDLIVLNRVPIILCMQVLKKGRLILSKDRKMHNAFVVRTLSEYFDLKRVRGPIEQKLVEFSILG